RVAVVDDVRGRAGEPAGEVAADGGGAHPVALAVPERHRHADLLRPKAPAARERVQLPREPAAALPEGLDAALGIRPVAVRVARPSRRPTSPAGERREHETRVSPRQSKRQLEVARKEGEALRRGYRGA